MGGWLVHLHFHNRSRDVPPLNCVASHSVRIAERQSRRKTTCTVWNHYGINRSVVRRARHHHRIRRRRVGPSKKCRDTERDGSRLKASDANLRFAAVHPARTGADRSIVSLSMQSVHLTSVAPRHLRSRIDDLEVYRHILIAPVEVISNVNRRVCRRSSFSLRQRLEVTAYAQIEDRAARSPHASFNAIRFEQAAVRQTAHADGDVDNGIVRRAAELALQEILAYSRGTLSCDT
ncbi:MAG: hypothetical protein JWN34_1111 [Bryobacterales bacterium]|nr:hypothetical protein [Bryobacterales bacterium]